MACKITFNNPVTGVNQTSLVGYMLTSAGIDNNSVVNYLENINKEGKPNKGWGNSKSSNLTGKFIEPDVTLAKPLLKRFKKLEDTVWMQDAQNFYDKLDLDLDREYSYDEAQDIITNNYNPTENTFSFIMEVVPGTENLVHRITGERDRRYKLYPVKGTYSNKVNFRNTFIREKESSLPLKDTNKYQTLGKVIDYQKPDVLDTINNLIEDPETTDIQKKLLRDLIPLLNLYENLKLNYVDSIDVDATEAGRLTAEEKENRIQLKIFPGVFNANDHSITISILGHNSLSELADTLIHELQHAVTVAAIYNPQTKAQKEFSETVKQAFEQYKEIYKDVISKNPTDTRSYGFTNEAEFIVAFMSDPSFREMLAKSKDPKPRNLFQKIADAIKKFLTSVHILKPTNTLVTQEDLEKVIDAYFKESIRKSVLPTEVPNYNKSLFKLEITPEDFRKFQSNYSTPEEFKNLLKEVLDSDKMNWNKLLQDARGLNLNRDSLNRIEELYNEITPEDAKKSVESFYDFMYETALYLRSIEQSLDHLAKTQTLTQEELFKKAYWAKEIGLFFTDYINEIGDIFGNRMIDTILEKPFKNVKTLSDTLVKKYTGSAAEAIAEKLADQFEKPTSKLKAKLEDEVIRLEKILDSATKAGNQTLARQTKFKIGKEKRQLEKLATKENLKRALRGKIEDVSQLSLYLESAALSGNLLTGTVGSYLSTLFDEANAEAIAIEVEAKQIADRLQKYLRSRGERTLTGFTIGDAFERFLEKRIVKQLVNGEIVERESYFLLSEMDEISYLNDKTQLEKELQDLLNKTDQGAITQAEIKKKQIELENLVEEYEESRYTPEYYRIQNLLTEEAKIAREEILTRMSMIKISPIEGEQSDDELDKLDALKVQLSQLESDYDEFGQIKDAEGLRIAENIREWKKERTAAELIQYELTENNRLIFESQLNKQNNLLAEAKANYETALATNDPNLEFYSNVYKQKIIDRNKWLKNNTVRKISPAFYTKRQIILDQISTIQKKYQDTETKETISDLYGELFSIIKGYKNEDGLYEGSKIKENTTVDGKKIGIPLRIKQIQDQIEKLQDEMSENTKIPKEDKKLLFKLFNKLTEMQQRVDTPDYINTVKNKKAAIRSQVVADSKFTNKPPQVIETEVNNRFRNTAWYKENHRQVIRYDSNAETAREVMEPLFFWKTTEPTDIDYINYDEPSFRWKTPKVNDIYINKERKHTKNQKRVSLNNTKTKYKNSKYGNLKAEEKEILESMLNLYTRIQKGLPTNLVRGLELPSVEREGIESIGSRKVGNLKTQISGALGSFLDEATFQTDEDLASDKERGSILNKAQRRLYLKYSRRIDSDNVDKISLNVLNSLVRYGTDVTRFKKVYENLPYIYGIQDVLEKEMPETKIRKTINNMLERRLNAQTRKTWTDNKLVNFAEWSINTSLGYSAQMALSLRLPSTIKNYAAGTANIYIQAEMYGIDRKDIAQAQYRVGKYFAPLFRSYIEDGIEHEYIQKVRYFNIMPDDHLSSAGKNVFNSEWKKVSKQYNPVAYLSFLRNFGEFEMRASVAEALSKNYLIQHTDGTLKPIMDSFEMVNGVLTPMSTIENMEDFKKTVDHFRGELNTINSYIHGAYGYMDKGEYTRYTLGRVMGYMKGWLVYQGMRRFGRRSISYRGGMESQGFYRTLMQATGLLIGNRSLTNTWELLSTREKNEVIAAGYDTLAIALFQGLATLIQSALYSDDDDDEDHGLAYFALYNILQIEDELATLHPIAGPTSIAYSRFVNNPDGKSAPMYYLEKTFILPFRGIYDAMRLSYEMLNPFDDISAFNEYVPRSRNGNVLNPNRYKPDPSITGQPEILARTLRLFGLNTSWNYSAGASPEYLFRLYERYNERWFLSSLDSDLKSRKSSINSYKKQIKAISKQINYTEDEETKDSLREMVSNLEKKIEDRKVELEQLSEIIPESYIQ